jgi:hypothetical protein
MYGIAVSACAEAAVCASSGAKVVRNHAIQGLLLGF